MPGAYPSGTNHFAHAGSPDDTGRDAEYGEKYGALRDANDTIGGGAVIETQARRHPRRREAVLERLARQESGSPEEPL